MLSPAAAVRVASGGPGSQDPRERAQLLRRYLDEIGTISVLSAGEERELAARLRASREALLAELATLPYTARALRRRWQHLLEARRVTGQLSELHDGTGQGERSAQVDRALHRIDALLRRRDRTVRVRASRADLERIDQLLGRWIREVRPTHGFLVEVLDELVVLADGVGSDRVGRRRLAAVVGLSARDLAPRVASAREIFARGREARDRFVYHNLRLVVHEAKRFRHMGVPFLDLIQEGNLGLLRAVEKFDERRGNRFSTYGCWWIQQSCVRAIQGVSRTVRLPSHIFDGVRRYRNARDRFEARHGRAPSTAELAPALGMAKGEVEALQRADVPIVPFDAPPVGTDLPLGERIAAPPGREGPAVVGDARLHAALRELLACLTRRERLILSWRFGLGDDRDRTLQEIGDELGLSRERVRQIEKEALRKLRDQAPDDLEAMLG